MRMESAAMPGRVLIREVCPRDGFQNVKDFIPTERKLEWIDALFEAGVGAMEITSFVSPKAIPQLADASEVLEETKRRHPSSRLTALVPNAKGAERALACGADVLNVVFSASESHNRANLNRTVEESLAGLDEIARLNGGRAELSVSIATSFMCPFEGRTDPRRVAELIGVVREKGARSLCLAETIGTCHPRDFAETLDVVKPALEGVSVALHIHNTFGMALLNVREALCRGFDRFDSAVGGLGGCPYAPGAAGNVATEDLVFYLNGLGIETGLDPLSLVGVARRMREWGLDTLGHLVKSGFGRSNEYCG